jgi:hypothetical protein
MQQRRQGAYLVMELTGWVVLVPLSLASLATGLVCSLGSAWGLFRHYWVLCKLVISVVATIVLLLSMQTLEHLGDIAAATTLSSRRLRGLSDPSPALHAAAALLLLLVATTLATHKPCGMTRYGQHPTPATPAPPTVTPATPAGLPQQRVESPVEV